MNRRVLWGVFIRIAAPTLCGGVAYVIWLAVFLLLSGLRRPVVEVLGWVSAPVVTAAGFASGAAMSGRLTKARGSRFLRIFVWPLIGCSFGAAVVYWFGPMLIVFGMFAAGTASIALREMILWSRGGSEKRKCCASRHPAHKGKSSGVGG